MKATDIEQARDAGTKALEQGPRATAATYEDGTEHLVLALSNGVTLRLDVSTIQGLDTATADDLQSIEITQGGLALRWESLDVDLDVPNLAKGVLGTRSWMAGIGSMGGSATSEAKRKSSRANGRKGGRPRGGATDTPNEITKADLTKSILEDMRVSEEEARTILDKLLAALEESATARDLRIAGTRIVVSRRRPRTEVHRSEANGLEPEG